MIEWNRDNPQRNSGRAKVFIVPNRTRATLEKIIREHCAAESTIYTDGWAAYLGMDW